MYCNFSLKAWLTLRRLCLDFGKKYYLRLQSLFSVIIIIAFVSIVFLILGELKIFKINDATRG